ncbi:MAG: 4Fe-4S dicluster domain-containing protein [Coriobacteriia bacterium]
MTQYAFFFDQSRCYNCHACVVSCRDWNDIDPGPVKWLRMLQWEKGSFPNMRMHVTFATCYHCENPVCVEACSNHALFKEDKYGAVLLDEDLCQGDRACWLACPYGAPQYEDDAPGTPMSKCDMCYDKLEAGEQPVCVMSCPGRALDFGPIEEMEKKYGTQRTLEDMPSGEREKPAIIFKPMDERKNLVPYDSEKALQLLQVRGDMPNVFEDIRDVTDVPAGLVGYDRLVMKAASVAENLARSKNEEG